jgi:hypothetical protein
MYSFRFGRSLGRWLIGLGVLAAFPFVGAGVASASMGGAPPATTNFRPDLRTVHILTGINAGRVQFCFDKPITIAAASSAEFALGGYRWDTILTGFVGLTPVLDATGDCAIVTMALDHSGSEADLNSYTFGTVQPGAVTASISGGQPNLADSSPSLDSTDHSGTTGHTTGPDLVGVTVGAPAGTNEIIYTFDQPVDTAVLDPGAFRYYNAAGNIQFGAAITGVDGTGDVRVAFGVPTVSDAVIAYVYHGDSGSPEGVNKEPVTPFVGNGGAYSDTPNPETESPTESVTVPGTGGVTARPDLVSAALVPGATNEIDYTFDQNVTLATVGAFVAVTSNGDEIRATSATVQADGKTVRATFSGPNIANYLEEMVVATVYDGGVTNAATVANFAQGKPVGGNGGAFATGFTNAPDATGVTFNSSSGQAVVNFDQRVAANAAGQPVDQTGAAATPLGNWLLLDANGNFLASPTSATVEALGPYLSDVRLTFANPPILAVAKSLEIVGNQASSNPANNNPYVNFAGAPAPAVFSFGNGHGAGVSGFNPAGNVQQILAPTASGASLQGHGVKIVLRRVHITHKTYLKTHHKRSRHHKHR